MKTVLIVGSGFIGSHLGLFLSQQGWAVTLASRTAKAVPEGLAWRPLDASREEQCQDLLARLQPDAVILVHGPSDVTWCEAHAEEAARVHVGITENICRHAPCSYKLMISTDNVFPGDRPRFLESDQTRPFNAYGRAKRAAEKVLCGQDAPSLTLRTSLVYGLERPGLRWLNFFQLCLESFRDGKPLEAPNDQWCTPILIDDMAAVLAYLLDHEVTGLLHLAGKERIDRANWARVIAQAFGFDPALVIGRPRRETRYASRPANSCLDSNRLDALLAPSGPRIRSVEAVARDLRARTLEQGMQEPNRL